MVNLTLPTISFNVNRFYPFRREVSNGQYKWYENIAVSYSSNLENQISSTEDQLFTHKTLQRARNGYSHRIPVNVNFKFLRFFNFTPALNYSGNLYTTQVKKTWDTATNSLKVDTSFYKLSYGHGFSPSTSLSFNPTIYGIAQFKKDARIQAIRHVLTPSVSVSYVPQLKSLVPDYYDTYTQNNGTVVTYCKYDNTTQGPPATIPKESGSLSFSLNNSLEMKVRSDKDTVTGYKKVKLIETLNFSSGYNIFAEEYNLSPISFNASTPIYKEIRLAVSGSISPYNIDESGRLTPRYYWKTHKGIGRITNASTSFGYTFQSGKGKTDDKQKGEDKTEGQKDQKDEKKQTVRPEDYAYFTVPWSFTFSYSLSYSKYALKAEVIQSLSFNGSISLTPKWQMGFNSGYDFEAKKFSNATFFNITRNLHCWTMSFEFSPFGVYRFYSFKISAISALLQDLKYDERKDYYDSSFRRY
jgi:hypothetical protein